MDATNLELKENSFDLTLCCEALLEIKDYRKGLEEIKRVSKKYSIISVPNEPLFSIANFMRGKYITRLGKHPDAVNFWSPKSFIKLLKDYFKVIETMNSAIARAKDNDSLYQLLERKEIFLKLLQEEVGKGSKRKKEGGSWF